MDLTVADRQPWLVTVIAGDTAVGAGFLVDDSNILTCAHVVNRSLGVPDENQQRPDQVLLVEWPRLPDIPRTRASVHPAGWSPITSRGEGDIAILRLADAAPPGSAPAPWATPKSLWKHSFRTFGYPQGRDRGEWAHGQLLGPVGLDWVQLEATGITGAALTAGYSGAPVWDDVCDAVVGMIVAHDVNPQVRIGFMVPYQVAGRAMRTARLQNDLARWAGKGGRLHSLSSERKYRTVRLNVPAVVGQLYDWLGAQEYDVSKAELADGLLLQARRPMRLLQKTSQPRLRSKLASSVPNALVIRVTNQEDGAHFQFRAGPWASSRSLGMAATVGVVVAAPFVAPFGAPFVAVALLWVAALIKRAAEVTDELVYSGEYGSPPDAA